jgi:hypothetical protein
MASEPTVDQPKPGFEVVTESEPLCLELLAPGGQLMAQLLIPGVTIEDVVLRVIPAFRMQTGVRHPVQFKLRSLTAQEREFLQAAQ